MRRSIGVALGENARALGLFRFDVQGAPENATFAYDGAWLAAADAFPVEPALALVSGLQFHRRERGG
jgi:serine/threonine-protein kinase HipA